MRAMRQLCSATLSGRPPEVQLCRVASYSRSATCITSKNIFGSMVTSYILSRNAAPMVPASFPRVARRMGGTPRISEAKA